MTKHSKKKQHPKKHSGPDRSSPYPVSRLAPPIALVDLAKEIQTADQMVNNRLSAKLTVIAEQIKNLQDEARKILTQAHHDQDLHRVRCHFKRIPGNTYHLYQKEDGSRYFSMLSPADWKPNHPPHRFIGSYRLENDMSWTPSGQADKTGVEPMK